MKWDKSVHPFLQIDLVDSRGGACPHHGWLCGGREPEVRSHVVIKWFVKETHISTLAPRAGLIVLNWDADTRVNPTGVITMECPKEGIVDIFVEPYGIATRVKMRCFNDGKIIWHAETVVPVAFITQEDELV